MEKIGKEIAELKKGMAQKDEEITGLKEENDGQKVQIVKLEDNNRAMKRKMERILFCMPNAKKCLISRALPAELLNEVFASLPMENAFDILAKMPNGLLARNVRKMLKGIELAMRNNKWNEAQCGTKIEISGGGSVLKHSGPDYTLNCVRAHLAIPKFNWNPNKSAITYFEVKIVAKQYSSKLVKKSRKIACLTYVRGRFKLGNARAFVRSVELVPIASIPPPDYIVGTEGIEIKDFVDAPILNLLENVAHLFENPQFTFNGSMLECEGKKLVCCVIKCLKGKIFELDLPHNCRLNDFNNLFPGVLDHFQSLKFYGSNLQTNFLLKWLANPRSDGESKLIKMTIYEEDVEAALIERIKNGHPATRSPYVALARYSKDKQEEQEIWKKEWEQKIWHQQDGASNSSGATISIYDK